MDRADPIPRSSDNDYTLEQAAKRREFVTARTGADLATVASWAIDPGATRGNVENFIGAVQMPLGMAGSHGRMRSLRVRKSQFQARLIPCLNYFISVTYSVMVINRLKESGR